jgi:hypothetical protein
MDMGYRFQLTWLIAAVWIFILYASNENITKQFVSLWIVVAIFVVYAGKLSVRQSICFGRKINFILLKRYADLFLCVYILPNYHVVLRSGERIPVWGEIFLTGPDRSWGSPSLLYNGYRASPGAKKVRRVDHPIYRRRWRKSRAMHLFPLCPFVACSRANFTFTFTMYSCG